MGASSAMGVGRPGNGARSLANIGDGSDIYSGSGRWGLTVAPGSLA